MMMPMSLATLVTAVTISPAICPRLNFSLICATVGTPSSNGSSAAPLFMTSPKLRWKSPATCSRLSRVKFSDTNATRKVSPIAKVRKARVSAAQRGSRQVPSGSR